MRVRTVLTEPLVHFLLLGGLLFAWFQWRTGGTGGSSNRIVVTSGQLASLSASFERLWMRPPTDAERASLVEEFIREEIAVREATAQGLEQGDIVIRRRLRQKLEFLLEDEVALAPPSDAELQAWLDAHPAQFQVQPVLRFQQVYINSDHRGAAAPADAEVVLGKLRSGADARTVGDATLLPLETGPAEVRDIALRFGEEFATAVARLDPGPWTGPIASGYGLHLVRVLERTPGGSPTLAQVRDEVVREVLSARRAAGVDSLYRRLREKYRVTIE